MLVDLRVARTRFCTIFAPIGAARAVRWIRSSNNSSPRAIRSTRVNVDQNRDLANRYSVQGIPCFVMVVEGKEVDRVVGATDRSRLEAMFSRNGVGPGVNS